MNRQILLSGIIVVFVGLGLTTYGAVAALDISGFDYFGYPQYNGVNVGTSNTNVAAAQGTLQVQYVVTTNAQISSISVTYCSGSGCSPSTPISSSFVQVSGTYYVSIQTPTMSANVPYSYFFVVFQSGGGASAPSEMITLTYVPNTTPAPACQPGLNSSPCTPPPNWTCTPLTYGTNLYNCVQTQATTTTIISSTSSIASTITVTATSTTTITPPNSCSYGGSWPNCRQPPVNLWGNPAFVMGVFTSTIGFVIAGIGIFMRKSV